MTKPKVRAAKFVVVLAAAVLAGLAATLAAVLVAHEILVPIYGPNLAPIDDTLPMVAAVWGSYLVGSVAGLAVLVLDWRRFVRGPRSIAGLERA